TVFATFPPRCPRLEVPGEGVFAADRRFQVEKCSCPSHGKWQGGSGRMRNARQPPGPSTEKGRGGIRSRGKQTNDSKPPADLGGRGAERLRAGAAEGISDGSEGPVGI